MDKDYYAAEYFRGLISDKEKTIMNIKTIINSIHPSKLFSKEYNIKEEDLEEDIIIDALNNNNNDIYKTFQILYGE